MLRKQTSVIRNLSSVIYLLHSCCQGLYVRVPVLPWALVLLVAAIALTCQRPDARPRQPIAFSHRIHAGDNGMSCQYCHGGVRRAPAAGLPSERLCMGCHQLVASLKPEIVRLRGSFEKRERIAWLRVNDLPDFVYFNHTPHVDRGFACQRCHGEVQTMAEVHPAVPLASMSFCVECHRQNGGPVDCYTCHR